MRSAKHVRSNAILSSVIPPSAHSCMRVTSAAICDNGPCSRQIVGERLLGSTPLASCAGPCAGDCRPTAAQGSHRNIGSCVDFSDPSRKAFSQRAGAVSLTTLHAYGLTPNWSAGRNAERSIGHSEAEETRRRDKRVKRDMEDLIAAAGRGASAIETAVMEGESRRCLLLRGYELAPSRRCGYARSQRGRTRPHRQHR